MELKSYQQQVISDLALFLDHIQETKDISKAFNNFWTNHPRTPLLPSPRAAIEPYKNNVPGAPNICIKVPTAGGKTFIACNAIRTIFDAFDYDRKKAVVWLVPSITILDQTIKNLKDPHHPYRQKINSHFGNRVEVYDKQALLQGSGFNPTSVKEQLSVFVLSFDSLRAKNKEERKVYQENGNLQSFAGLIGNDDDISLMRVIQSLNPVVIVDESHNAESDLSVEMLKNLEPCFVLDLTATPRNNSNIISFVDAIELKKENMVKLPVIVYNHQDKTEVINSALQLQRKLELQANEERKNGGKYIRPIVLFQAQPKNDNDNTTFELLKKKLVELKIPEEQIKIKTANLNELKNIDLMSEDCPVRFIITVNALKEGWDCPFAYILASLADKSSAVDVEQILGRVLRQPYVTKHKNQMLNMSYVITASSRFMDTLGNIVKGLNKAGFSSKDYKVAADVFTPEKQDSLEQLTLTQTPKKPDTSSSEEDITQDIDTSRISPVADAANTINSSIAEIEKSAIEQAEEFEQIIAQSESNSNINMPTELQQLVKTYSIKDIFKEQAKQIKLPQFHMNVSSSDIFGIQDDVMLEKESLMDGFQLSKCDIHINFDNISSELYKVDLDETKKDFTPVFAKIDGKAKEQILSYILAATNKESKISRLTQRLMALIKDVSPISDTEVKKFVERILEGLSDEQFNDFANYDYSYVKKIEEKIDALSEQYREKRFRDYLDTDKITIKPSYSLSVSINPGNTAKDITKSLYEKEGDMNGFEERVVNEIANLSNIVFWTRNIERKGFRINGFINHYPDFIVQTKNGKILVIETKGDDRDNSDSEAKIKLGQAWASKAGNNFKYFMVFDKKEVDGAYRLDNFLKLIQDI